jgi:2'-5' RNA ligase
MRSQKTLGKKSRLFVGIPLAEEARSKLKPLLQELKLPGINTVPTENLHFTVKFLGEVEEEKIAEIIVQLEKLVQSFSVFMVEFTGVGAFPDLSAPQVLWLGAKSTELLRLMQDTDAALDHLRKDEHASGFPHLTLARIKLVKDYPRWLEKIKAFDKIKLEEMRVDNIVLYESILGKDGPRYKVVKEFRLKGIVP